MWQLLGRRDQRLPELGPDSLLVGRPELLVDYRGYVCSNGTIRAMQGVNGRFMGILHCSSVCSFIP